MGKEHPALAPRGRCREVPIRPSLKTPAAAAKKNHKQVSHYSVIHAGTAEERLPRIHRIYPRIYITSPLTRMTWKPNEGKPGLIHEISQTGHGTVVLPNILTALDNCLPDNDPSFCHLDTIDRIAHSSAVGRFLRVKQHRCPKTNIWQASATSAQRKAAAASCLVPE